MPSLSRFSLLFSAVAFLVLVASPAAAQQRLNFLAIDNELVDAAGPYYFTEYGDSSNAFAAAGPFAEALGLEVEFDNAAKQLIFERGGTTAVLDTTSDVAAGLERHPGALVVDGAPFSRAVPQGILVDGTSYVAIAPIVEAFGGVASWHGDARVVAVETGDPVAAAVEGGGRGGSLRELGQPRVGQHDGFTRVALDLPDALEAELAVGDGALALRVSGGALPELDRVLDDGALQRLYSEQTNGVTSLVLVTDHEVGADGSGYRMGRTQGGTVYVDVGEGLNGPPAQAANVEPRGRPQRIDARAAPTERSRTVVIDAGHGGHDPGTTSPWAHEDGIVLNIALKLRDRLEPRGVEVILTRDENEFLSLQERSRFATTERNLFVSIHANAAANRSAHGVETWVFGRPLDPSLIEQAIRENGGGELGQELTQAAAESADIASDILSESQLNYSMDLAHSVQDRMVAATGARDRGVRQNLFYVIRTARIPAILVEVGFVSNPEEGRRLTRDAYQSRLAEALADGITEFLGTGGRVAQR